MSRSICCAALFAPLANRLMLDKAMLCGCEQCHSLPELCAFVDNSVTIFRLTENDCPECVVTRRYSPNRLPDAGTGAAPQGAAQEHGSGNPERATILGLEVGK